MFKKSLSLILSVLMILSVIIVPVAVSAEDSPVIGEDTNLRARYLFAGSTADSQRDKLDATAYGTCKFVEDSKFGMVLDTGSSGYLTIPGNVLTSDYSKAESFTFATWVNIPSWSWGTTLFQAGKDSRNCFYVTPHTRVNNSAYGVCGGIKQNNTVVAYADAADTYSPWAGRGWFHIAWSVDTAAQTITYYLNGEQISQRACTLSFNDIMNVENPENYKFYINATIGATRGSVANAKIFDLRLYDIAKDAAGVAEIMNSALTDEAKVNNSLVALNLGNLENRTEDITLPAKSPVGPTFTWASSNENIITTDGKVIRPAYSNENDTETVVLTATATLGELTASKEFTVTVPKMPTPETVVAQVKEALDLGDLSDLTESITVPTAGVYGAAITWESSNSYMGADGTVTRPTSDLEDAVGTLTATIKYSTNDTDEAVETKAFDFRIRKWEADELLCQWDAEAINIGSVISRKDDFVLPTVGPKTGMTTITWTTSNADYVTADGKVTRPTSDYPYTAATVILKAYVEKGDATVINTYAVTVPRQSTAAKFVSANDIECTTEAGYLPKLPYYIDANYIDGMGNPVAGDQVRVVWYGYETAPGSGVYTANPATDATAFANVGDVVTVKGYVSTTEGKYEVKATVTVVEKTEKVSSSKIITDFNLSKVSLDSYDNGTDSVFKRHQDLFIHKLAFVADPDRFLYAFRYAFGEDAPKGKALGSWDSLSTKLRGHATGHYLVALAQAYQDTLNDEDQSTHEKLGENMNYIIDELYTLSKMSQGDPTKVPPMENPPTQNINGYASNIGDTANRRKDVENWGEGYISAYPPDQFIMIEMGAGYSGNDNGVWAPYYTLHKILSGLIACYEVAGNEKALEIATGMGKWVAKRLKNLDEATLYSMWNRYIAGEYGGMNESMAEIARITGDEEIAEGAILFDNVAFFYGADKKSGLANNVDTIRGRHANQHIPQIIGSLKIYEVTGDYKHYEVAENFWDMAFNSYSYSIGGVAGNVSNSECFNAQPDIISTMLHDGQASMCETCATYNMLKLSRQLFMFTGDVKYMDYYEKAWYNQIAASVNDNCGNTYHIPLDGGSSKSFGGGNLDGFTCCNGTAIESNSKLQDTIYFQSVDGDALYVNLYIPSTLQMNENVTIKQTNNFPYEDTTKITVIGSGNFDMKVRVPSWATAGFVVKVNGEVADITATPGSYISVGTTWNDGDTVELQMPFEFNIRSTPDNVNKGSIYYGPILLAGTESSSLSALRKINIDDEDIANSVSGDQSKFEFKVDGVNSTLKPFWEYTSGRYSVYYDITRDDVNTDAPEVTAVTDKEVYAKNDAVNVTVVTSSDCDDILFMNENDKFVTKKAVSKTVNNDGSVTWVYEVSFATKGDREISVLADLGEGYVKYTSFDVKIVNEVAASKADPEIFCVGFENPEVLAVKVNKTFKLAVETSKSVTDVKFYNEKGVGIGKSLVSKTVEGDKIVYVYSLAIGTAGSRVISVGGVDATGNTFTTDKTMAIKVVK